MTTAANRFAPGTFAPRPRAASLPTILVAQSRMELTLLLRNGEQLLLTMFIPITLLVGLCLLPLDTDLGASTAERATTFVPAIMTVAVMSTAFTGQAIALGFDRRYGALKRLGATPIPRWGIIAGKSIAVVLVVVLQAVILGAIGIAFGWRPSAVGIVLGALVIAIGTITFSALGLLLGGTLKAEVVLALGNLLWFAMVGVGSLVVMGDFNDGPGLDAQERLFGRSGIEIVLGEGEVPERRLYDPHAALALSHPMAAQPATARFAVPPDWRILSALLDYAMISPDLRTHAPRWRIWHPFDDPAIYADTALREALLAASDHFPVTLDLDLTGKSAPIP